MAALNEEHTKAVVEYLRFMRYKRAQRVRGVDTSFNELKESRLMEDNTFTADEVASMLDGLCLVVKGDVESELIDSAHSNVILLRQMFGEAEKWHLKLQPDIALLEQKDLLEEIAQFEREQLTASASQSKPAKLNPLDSAASPALLQMEMSRVKEDAGARCKAAEQETVEVKAKLQAAQQELENLKKQLAAKSAALTEAVAAASKAAPTPTSAPAPAPASSASAGGVAEAEKLKKELTEAKHEILRVTAELDTAKKDLERKFHDTTQYANMKKMLETKNAQIKELRAQLGHAE